MTVERKFCCRSIHVIIITRSTSWENIESRTNISASLDIRLVLNSAQVLAPKYQRQKKKSLSPNVDAKSLQPRYAPVRAQAAGSLSHLTVKDFSVNMSVSRKRNLGTWELFLALEFIILFIDTSCSRQFYAMTCTGDAVYERPWVTSSTSYTEYCILRCAWVELCSGGPCFTSHVRSRDMTCDLCDLCDLISY